jgi:hypothetical protein
LELLLGVEDEVDDPLVCGFNQAFVAHRDLVLSDHFLQDLLVLRYQD